MDISSLLNGDPGRWYRVPGSNAEVKIRQVKPQRSREIVRATTRQILKRGRLVEKSDQERANDLFLQEAVMDWRGIERDGEPLPITPENRRLLDNNWPEFASLWNQIVVRDEELVDEIEEAELKN